MLSRRLIPNAAALQAFEAAARHQNFTRAALELNLTQSAISRQIKELEAQLGVQLFERVRQRVVLSASGQRLLPEVRLLLQRLEDMTIRAIATREMTGTLSVATLPTFGSRWLMPRLPGFLRANPGVQVTLSARSAPFDMAGENTDLAIHYGKPVWPGATCHFLCREDVVPVAAPQIVEAFRAGGDIGVAGLARLPLLQMDARPRLWADWLARYAGPEDAAYRGHRFDQFTLLIEAAVLGIGVGLIPRYLIERELEQDRLRIILDLPLRTELGYYVVLPEGKSGDPLCRLFHAWIAGQVSHAPERPELPAAV